MSHHLLIQVLNLSHTGLCELVITPQNHIVAKLTFIHWSIPLYYTPEGNSEGPSHSQSQLYWLCFMLIMSSPLSVSASNTSTKLCISPSYSAKYFPLRIIWHYVESKFAAILQTKVSFKFGLSFVSQLSSVECFSLMFDRANSNWHFNTLLCFWYTTSIRTIRQRTLILCIYDSKGHTAIVLIIVYMWNYSNQLCHIQTESTKIKCMPLGCILGWSSKTNQQH